jgi:hypothetical protein
VFHETGVIAMNIAFTSVISATLLSGIMLAVHESSAEPGLDSGNAPAIDHLSGHADDQILLTGSDEPGMWKSFEQLHDRYTQAFVDSDGFGISRILTFDSPEKRAFLVNGRKRRINNVQLIGLMNDAPRAYASSFMNPTRSMLATSAQRPLTDFEKQAIERLKTGTDYVLSGDGHQPDNPHGTLIAALRAGHSCMSCHDVKHGQLLGAFAYRLDAALPNRKLNLSGVHVEQLLTSLRTQPE